MLTAGRDLDYDNYHHTDTASCVINESAAQVLGFANTVGQNHKRRHYQLNIVRRGNDFTSAPKKKKKKIMRLPNPQ